VKINRVKFYQAVSIFNGQKFQLVTHLNMDNPEISGKLSLELLAGTGLLVHTDGDSTLITLNNVAYLNYEKEEKPKTTKKA